uniref:Uncharacterized protein n=1 Tax=Arundo donax TaxID=35708 RepID=A0A0A9AHW9_ARUDO
MYSWSSTIHHLLDIGGKLHDIIQSDSRIPEFHNHESLAYQQQFSHAPAASCFQEMIDLDEYLYYQMAKVNCRVLFPSYVQKFLYFLYMKRPS